MQAIVIGRKSKEIFNRRTFAMAMLPVLFMTFREVQLAALEPVCASIDASSLILANLFAGVLNLAASRRLMLETLLTCYHKPRAAGLWPTLSEWMTTIENIRVNAVSRLGQYREAALFALKSLHIELRDSIDYASSDFLARLAGFKGVLVISTAGLSAEAESLFAALFVNAAYHAREHADPDTLEPLVFVLDDCLPLIRGTSAMDAEGSNQNPLATFTHMGRSRKIGFVLSAQNYGIVSPSVAANCATVIAFASYGEDAEKLARHLALTREQAAVLPTLQPGECIAVARTIYPVAVRGRVPLIE